jgi:hypothetical protein
VFLGNSAKAYSTNGLSLANGVAETRQQVQFKVRVMNASDRHRPKGYDTRLYLTTPDVDLNCSRG